MCRDLLLRAPGLPGPPAKLPAAHEGHLRRLLERNGARRRRLGGGAGAGAGANAPKAGPSAGAAQA